MALVNAYTTVDELSSKMGLDDDKKTLHLSLLENSINSASRFIDLKTNTFFYQKTIVDEKFDVYAMSDEKFYFTPDLSTIVAPAPIITITSLEENGVALTEISGHGDSGEFVVKYGAGLLQKPYSQWTTSILGLKLNGVIGYLNVPTEVNEICQTIAATYTRLDNKIVTNEQGDIEGILNSKIPSWVFKSLKRLERPIL